jgi:hypothetical protein
MDRRVLARSLLLALVVVGMSAIWIIALFMGSAAAHSSPACQAGLATLEVLEARHTSPDDLFLDAVEQACGH